MPQSEPTREEAPTEESVQEDLSRLEAYRSQLSAILRQQEMLRMTIIEHARSGETLEGLADMDRSAEILAPVGADTFVKVTPSSTERVLVGIGSGMVVELDREKGLSMINERLQGLERADKDMTQEIIRLDREAQAISQRLQTVMSRQERDRN